MSETAMKTVIGVRFRTAGKIYYFDPLDHKIRKGDDVIVETAGGIEYGLAICDPMTIPEGKVPKQLKNVLRIATAEDRAHQAENRGKEKEAFRICQEKIRRHGLDMKLIDVEYTFDNSKVLFYFAAEGRVDFRELVKDLATAFRTRIELRQIGVRDEAKLLGGYGICGRPLCCHTYLSDFAPVSIRMAKEQNLSLNPTKISGTCGRLMCCLKNEEDIYEELNRKLPRPGDEVEGNDGLRGEVSNVNILRQTVRILVEIDDEKELHEYGAGEWTLIHKRRKGKAQTPKKVRVPEEASGRQDKKASEEHTEKIEKLPEKPFEKSRGRQNGRSADRQEEKSPAGADMTGDFGTGKREERRGDGKKHFRQNQRKNGNRPSGDGNREEQQEMNGERRTGRNRRPHGQG